MWKRLDERIATSEKHAQLGFNPFVLWTMMLPHTDSQGRYWANATFVRGQCLPMFADVRLDQVDSALAALGAAGLIHLFDVGGKKYLVYHDHDDFNPTGAIRYTRPQWPDPPVDLCKCQRRESAANTLPVMSSSSSSSSSSGPPDDQPTDALAIDTPYGGGLPAPELQAIFNGALKQADTRPPPKPQDTVLHHLLQLVPRMKSTSTLKAWRPILEGTRARFGAQAVEQWLMDPSNVGKSAFDMEKELAVLCKGNDVAAKVKLKVQMERRSEARRQVAEKMLAFLKDHSPLCQGCKDCNRDRVGLRELGFPEDRIPRPKREVAS